MTTIEKERRETFSKKIDEIKRTFHAKIGTIKDKQGTDLMEKEDIKNRWREYTEELYKKTIELEPDILESEIKWALECIANNKAPGIDEIPAELFKILGDDEKEVLKNVPIIERLHSFHTLAR
ncbi:unnamed protein product [Rotaria socialis]|uniref:Uncharacterized protein n=1 Tax=Rotaria socialis TaxID=392032 RepID=A0A818XU10_9BILA|nr:unnamed protein product [Rotaria socialis]CAF4871371.1 unnamed protein product [Rotaria socialis]